MDATTLIDQLAANGDRLAALMSDVREGQVRWRPNAESWSLLEVACHLHDEEREDFRPRLDVILHRPDDSWTPIDPQGWVTSRRYGERDLETERRGFLEERAASLAWLRGLEAPDWDASYDAPWGSPIRAGDMLAAWVAHDLLHMRQLVELHNGYVRVLTGDYRPDYAGEW